MPGTHSHTEVDATTGETTTTEVEDTPDDEAHAEREALREALMITDDDIIQMSTVEFKRLVLRFMQFEIGFDLG